MFSRRHPFLFFILVMTAMIISGCVVLSALFFSSDRDGRHFARGEKIGVIERAVLTKKECLKTIADLTAAMMNNGIYVRKGKEGEF